MKISLKQPSDIMKQIYKSRSGSLPAVVLPAVDIPAIDLPAVDRNSRRPPEKYSYRIILISIMYIGKTFQETFCMQLFFNCSLKEVVS
jgi:hypothetical protein